MKKNASVVFYVFLILLVGSCTKNHITPDQKTNIVIFPPNRTSVIQASNKFAFDFFHATLQTDADRNNKLISPLSIYLALSMVYNGADHATKDSMETALNLKGIDIKSR